MRKEAVRIILKKTFPFGDEAIDQILDMARIYGTHTWQLPNAVFPGEVTVEFGSEEDRERGFPPAETDWMIR